MSGAENQMQLPRILLLAISALVVLHALAGGLVAVEAQEVDDPAIPEAWILRFESGDSRLPEGRRSKLEQVARQLSLTPDLNAVIVGHSDSSGVEIDNLRLSLERALEAKRYLVEKLDVDAARILTEAKGSLKPISPNDTPDGRRRNRRAVIVLRPAEVEN